MSEHIAADDAMKVELLNIVERLEALRDKADNETETDYDGPTVAENLEEAVFILHRVINQV